MPCLHAKYAMIDGTLSAPHQLKKITSSSDVDILLFVICLLCGLLAQIFSKSVSQSQLHRQAGLRPVRRCRDFLPPIISRQLRSYHNWCVTSNSKSTLPSDMYPLPFFPIIGASYSSAMASESSHDDSPLCVLNLLNNSSSTCWVQTRCPGIRWLRPSLRAALVAASVSSR